MKSAHGPEICPALAAALNGHPRALKIFESMPPSHQREYNQHVAEAKKEATQISRAEKALTMIVKWKK